ncbi:MAG: TolC family protein [Bacteroidales bacterium]|nr:TolC family protein [Bacteroidales bacterium]
MRLSKILIMPLLMALCSVCAFAQHKNVHTLSIKEMFELADSNNVSIKLHNIAMLEADERIKIAKNAYLPSIETSLSLSYNGDGIITDRDFSNSFSVEIPDFGNNFSIKAKQVIFAAGSIKNNVEISQVQSEITTLNARQNRQEIRFMIVSNYLEICEINNQLKIFDTHIQQIEKVLNEMKIRHEQGTVLNNDVIRYELELQNLNHQKAKLENTKQILNNQLLILLGLDENTTFTPDTSEIDNMIMKSEEELTKETLNTSIPMQLAQQNILINEYKVRLSLSERLPKIVLFAFNNLDGPVTIDIPALNNNFNYWGVGIGISYNIDNFYKSNKQIKADRLALQKSKYQANLIKDKIKLESKAAYIKYREAFTLLQTKEKSLELAKQNYETINFRYHNGLALITELLDATTQKLNAELEMVNARINILFNYYKLQFISGTL